ncbi:MAG: ABC transporter permease [Anaerolineae bacterium]|nr:ABC transporter permease [Anaerolineae bacterium]
MFRHILRRLLQAIPTIFGITLLSYAIMSLAPGSALGVPDDPNMRPEQRAIMRERLGLNDPWYIQYVIWLTGNDWMHPIGFKDLDMDDNGTLDASLVRYGILRGDFGRSLKYKIPAIDLYLSRLPATAELGVATLLVSMAIGIPVGIMAAIWRGGAFDNGSRVFAVVGNAVPTFWLGLLLLMFFGTALDLQWARGQQCDKTVYSRQPCPPIQMRLEYLIMPTLMLGFGGVAGYSRYMRTSMLDTIHSDYVRTARAKGLPRRAVWVRHAARNAMIPLATFLGPSIVGVVAGAPITEQIFSWPGVGRLTLEAVSGRDFPIVMVSVLVAALLTVVAYIISDIAYAIVDPRIRF